MPIDHLSTSGHVHVACFIAAAHRTMLSRLEQMQKENGLDGSGLLSHWHSQMESYANISYRKGFFSEVVAEAKKVSASRHLCTS
jgi:hypothetical protein